MKKIIYLITFFVIGQWLYAQNNSDSSYYPLDVNNRWCLASSIADKIEIQIDVLKDTLLIDGLRYYKIEQKDYTRNNSIVTYEYVDSIGNVWKYDYNENKRLLLEDFHKDLMEPFFSYRMDTFGNWAFISKKGIAFNPIVGKFTEFIKVIYKRSYDEDAYIYFSKNYGIFQIFKPIDLIYELRGAKIGKNNYGILSVIEQKKSLPKSIELCQNYPNPFNPTSKVKYKIDKEELVTARVFDILGREVRFLFSEKKKAGEYSIDLNMKNFNSGIYFLQLSTKSCIKSIKMLLVK